MPAYISYSLNIRQIIQVPKSKLARISITLPQSTLIALDKKIVQPDYENRSQAIVEMIHQQLVSKNDQANAVMVGTLTVLYSIQSKNIHYQIIDLQQQYLKQVISSQHIQLDDQKIMQVMLLQGKSHDLKRISQNLIALKGVIKGHLELMDAVMPPLAQNDQQQGQDIAYAKLPTDNSARNTHLSVTSTPDLNTSRGL